MIAAHLAGLLSEAAARAFPGQPLPALMVERAREVRHGDFAANAPLALAGVLKRSPAAIAEALIAALPNDPAVSSATFATPGFVNFRLSDAWLWSRLEALLAEGVRLPDVGCGQRVEAVAPAPPTSPAQGRAAVWGEVVVRLLAATGHQLRVLENDDQATYAWQLKTPGSRADHDHGGPAAPVSVTPREAAASLERVLGATGRDAFRLMAVMRAANLPLDLNLEAIAGETLDNPVFLLPYTHARLAGLVRLARQEGGFEGPVGGMLSFEPEARELLLLLLVYPDVVADAALHRAPHRLVRHLLDLSSAFHRFYARHRVFGQPPFTACLGMGMIQGTLSVLRHAMRELLDVSTPEQVG